MPMALLLVLAQAPLPCVVDDLDDIEKLRVLATHGHVEAMVPQWNIGRMQLPATVQAVTPLGRKALRYFGPVDRSSP